MILQRIKIENKFFRKMFEKLKHFKQFEQLLLPSNHRWWLLELYFLIISIIRVIIYFSITFMHESLLQQYCSFDSMAAFIFNFDIFWFYLDANIDIWFDINDNINNQ